MRSGQNAFKSEIWQSKYYSNLVMMVINIVCALNLKRNVSKYKMIAELFIKHFSKADNPAEALINKYLRLLIIDVGANKVHDSDIAELTITQDVVEITHFIRVHKVTEAKNRSSVYSHHNISSVD